KGIRERLRTGREGPYTDAFLIIRNLSGNVKCLPSQVQQGISLPSQVQQGISQARYGQDCQAPGTARGSWAGRGCQAVRPGSGRRTDPPPPASAGNASACRRT